MTDLLQVRNLEVEFMLHEGAVRAVDGVSFRVRQGSTVALVGESGSGKSVVSQAVLGILPKQARIVSGEILFADPRAAAAGNPEPTVDAVVDIARLERDSKQMRSIRGGQISMIFQEPMTSLSPLHTIGDQVIEALWLHRDVSKSTATELTEEMLRMVGFPDPAKALWIYPFELSGGLRQRAMIAMALVCRPVLLIADEPTTALDVTIQGQILQLIKQLQAELRMAVLLITHDLGVVANMADEVVVVYHGKVVECGALREIFADPRHPYLRALMRAVPRFGMKPGERLTPIREVSHAGGAHLAAGENWSAEAAAGPLLQIRDLSKSFRVKNNAALFGKSSAPMRALDGVSFDVQKSECLGLVGESGCGKTTLSKIVMRALSPDQGQIHFNDRGRQVDVLALTDKDLLSFRTKIQMIFQDPFSALNPRMTVFDIISEPLVIHAMGDAGYRAEVTKELVRLVGLDVRFLSRYPHSFSGGQRQRIGIARALALKPDLLICDEPVSALDVSVQAQILNLLKDLQKELGLTYLFISHNLAVVDYMAQSIAVMCAGQLVETAPREALFQNPVHPYTQALLAAVPRTDPNSKLDLTALMEGKASNPAEWPSPFTVNPDTRPKFIDLGRRHFVRASDSLQLHAQLRGKVA